MALEPAQGTRACDDREPQRVVGVLGFDHAGHWTEQLVGEGRHSRRDIGQNGGLKEVGFVTAAGQKPGARRDRRLDALVDEATGYQYERAEDALQVKLRAFIADELRDWEKTFPDELWQEFGRLTKWKGALHSRPKWWGKLVIELIYDTLDPDVAEYLKANKPKGGIHWHRQLTENVGVRQLVSRCYEIIGMAKTCDDIHELRQRVAQHYGKKPVQFTLFLKPPGK